MNYTCNLKQYRSYWRYMNATASSSRRSITEPEFIKFYVNNIIRTTLLNRLLRKYAYYTSVHNSV